MMTYTITETNLERQHLLARFLDPMTLNVLRNIALPQKATILDVGCGLGDTSLLLQEHYPSAHITGIDADAALIDAAIAEKEWRHPYLHFVQGDALQLPFEDNSFDLVFCRFVLHHIPDAPAALQEMKRVCKPGGLVFAQEPDIHTILPYPENDAYDRAIAYVNILFADAIIGRKLIHYFKETGIKDCQHNAQIALADHVSGNKKLFSLTCVALRDAILKMGLLNDEEFDEWLAEIYKTDEDEGAVLLSFPVISVWGSKDESYI